MSIATTHMLAGLEKERDAAFAELRAHEKSLESTVAEVTAHKERIRDLTRQQIATIERHKRLKKQNGAVTKARNEEKAKAKELLREAKAEHEQSVEQLRLELEAEKEVIECVSSQPLPGGLPRYAVTGGCTKDPYTGECDPDYAMTAVVGAALMPTSTELVDRFDAQCNGGKCDASFHRVGCNPMTNKQVQANGKTIRNCTEACEIFLSCVGAAPYAGKGVLANKSNWLIPGERNLYNKSLVMNARRKCFDVRQVGLAAVAALECVDIWQPEPDDPPVSRDNPKRATCLDFDCFFCGQTLWSKYFLCATTHCGQVPAAQPCFL